MCEEGWWVGTKDTKLLLTPYKLAPILVSRLLPISGSSFAETLLLSTEGIHT